MDLHDPHCINLRRFLDQDLASQEREAFSRHLAACEGCRKRLAEEQALSAVIRESRPLYVVPDALRRRVQALALHESPPLSEKSVRFRTWMPPFLEQMHLNRTAVCAATLVVALGLVLIGAVERQARAMTYISMSVAAHRKYLNGDLPLRVHSESPKIVAAWFAGKLPFDFNLPVNKAAKPALVLLGGEVLKYDGSFAAFVTYTSEKERISLVTASTKAVVIAGGQEIRFGNLTFHYCRYEGFSVVTWVSHGAAYALVSSQTGFAAQPCMVCHQNLEQDRLHLTQ